MWTLTYPQRPWSLNTERTWHHHQRARIVKEWREAFFWLAKEAHVPALPAAHIEVRIGQLKYKLVDVGNHLPSAKAAIDGIVDAGVLKEDNPRYLKSLTFWAPVKDKDHLTLIIRSAE